MGEETENECLDFVFSRRNRQLLAYGMKQTTLQDNTVIELPKVKGTMSIRTISSEYFPCKVENLDVPSVGRTNFMKLLKVVLADGSKCLAVLTIAWLFLFLIMNEICRSLLQGA